MGQTMRTKTLLVIILFILVSLWSAFNTTVLDNRQLVSSQRKASSVDREQTDETTTTTSCNTTTSTDVNTAAAPVSNNKMIVRESDIQQDLRDFSLVLMGDSITRYQYLSLVYFLRWGRWFDSKRQQPNLVQETTFRSPFHNEDWLEFYWATNLLLSPYESCDCFRPTGLISRRLHQVCENRYYYDPERNISVTYIQAFGNNPFHGHWNASTALKQAPGAKPPRELLPYEWNYKTWHETVRHHIAQLDPKPSFAVVNAGLWGSDFLLPESVHTELAKAFQDSGIRGIWKTTTSQRNGVISPENAKVDSLMCGVLDGCLNLTWTKKLNKSLWWNAGHFHEPVYRRINEQMLEMLGFQVLPSPASQGDISPS